MSLCVSVSCLCRGRGISRGWRLPALQSLWEVEGKVKPSSRCQALISDDTWTVSDCKGQLWAPCITKHKPSFLSLYLWRTKLLRNIILIPSYLTHLSPFNMFLWLYPLKNMLFLFIIKWAYNVFKTNSYGTTFPFENVCSLHHIFQLFLFLRLYPTCLFCKRFLSSPFSLFLHPRLKVFWFTSAVSW